jgi:hypothetical protein
MGKRAREHALVLKVPNFEYGRCVCLRHAYRRVRAGARQWVAIARARRQRVEEGVV